MGKDWSLYAALMEHWVAIVGADYAHQTAPVKITFPHGGQKRTGAQLTIRLPSGLGFAFSHQIPMIQSRINSYFGYEAIGRIVLATYYPEPKTEKPRKAALSQGAEKTLEKLTSNIENNELKDSLKVLGASIFGHQNP